MELGQRIRFWRRQAELSQADVSEMCGWGRANSRLSTYERNIAQPEETDLERICKAVGISLDQLLVDMPRDANGITRGALKNLTSKEKVDLLAKMLTEEEFSQIFQQISGTVLPK